MLTVNIQNQESGFIQSTNPQSVEVYIGAMESYEHFNLGGVKWKLPTAMVEDLIEAYHDKAKNEPLAYTI